MSSLSFYWLSDLTGPSIEPLEGPVWSLLGCHYPVPDLAVDHNCTQRGRRSVEPLAPYSTAKHLKQATYYMPSLLSAIMRPIFPIRLTIGLDLTPPQLKLHL